MRIWFSCGGSLIHAVVGITGDLWWLPDDPLRMAGVGHGEGVRAAALGLLSESVVDVMGDLPRDAGMAMLVVVPARRRRLAVRSGPVLGRWVEPVPGRVRTVLQRLVVGLRRDGSIGDQGPGVTTVHVQIGRRLRDGAEVIEETRSASMVELPGGDVLFGQGVERSAARPGARPPGRRPSTPLCNDCEYR